MTGIDSDRDQIDVFVGAAMKRLRRQRGMSQQALGAALGMSFQQIQKYESGSNRLSVSGLFKASIALGAEPSDLLPAIRADGSIHQRPSAYTSGVDRLMESYLALPARQRRAVLQLVLSMSGAPLTEPGEGDLDGASPEPDKDDQTASKTAVN